MTIELELGKGISKKFSSLIKIGEGAHGDVYIAREAKNANNTSLFALKLIREKKIYQHETKILKKIRQHSNICSLKQNFEFKATNGCRYGVIVMEKMDMDLLCFLLQRKSINENIVKVIFRAICEGIFYLHSNGVVHLDIKSENVLLQFDKNKRNEINESSLTKVKICDFGFARRIKKNNRKTKNNGETFGTNEYRAPEIRLKQKYISYEKADIWSLGILLFTAMTGYFPYRYDSRTGNVVEKFDLEILKYFSSDEMCFNLVAKLLSEDFEERPSISEVLNDPWFYC